MRTKKLHWLQLNSDILVTVCGDTIWIIRRNRAAGIAGRYDLTRTTKTDRIDVDGRELPLSDCKAIANDKYEEIYLGTENNN